MGRPPVGKQAMSSTERSRRRRARLRSDRPATKQSGSAQGDDSSAEIALLQDELAQARKRIAELEQGQGGGLVRRGQRAHGVRIELNELRKLEVETARLRARIALLRPTVEGEVVKLRKAVETLRGERAALMQALKEAAKQRDKLQDTVNRLTTSKLREKLQRAGDRLNHATYKVIVKCLHADRLRECTKAELDEASRSFIELRPLFDPL